MGKKEKVFESEVGHEGIFDFKKLYNFIYNFLKDKEYSVSESAYSEKVTEAGKEIEVKWDLSKEVTDYVKYIGKVKIVSRGLKGVEVQKNGKKENMNKGEVKVAVKAEIERDYKGAWEGSVTKEFFRGIYDTYIAGKRYKELKEKYSGDLDELVAQVKSFLVLEGIK